MSRILLSCSAFVVTVVLSTLAGCGQSPYSGETRYPLKGTVTLDGTPIDGGSISFMPLDDKHKVAGGAITNGTYSVPENQGANAGAYRVEVHWMKPTGKKIPDSDLGGTMDEVKEVIPPKYSTFNSELTANVDGSNTEFNFELLSK
ncbi:MAG: hypothetical protein R3C49_18645 [Planctomycetaceae bacterium]